MHGHGFGVRPCRALCVAAALIACPSLQAQDSETLSYYTIRFELATTSDWCTVTIDSGPKRNSRLVSQSEGLSALFGADEAKRASTSRLKMRWPAGRSASSTTPRWPLRRSVAQSTCASRKGTSAAHRSESTICSPRALSSSANGCTTGSSPDADVSTECRLSVRSISVRRFEPGAGTVAGPHHAQNGLGLLLPPVQRAGLEQPPGISRTFPPSPTTRATRRRSHGTSIRRKAPVSTASSCRGAVPVRSPTKPCRRCCPSPRKRTSPSRSASRRWTSSISRALDGGTHPTARGAVERLPPCIRPSRRWTASRSFSSATLLSRTSRLGARYSTRFGPKGSTGSSSARARTRTSWTFSTAFIPIGRRTSRVWRRSFSRFGRRPATGAVFADPPRLVLKTATVQPGYDDELGCGPRRSPYRRPRRRPLVPADDRCHGLPRSGMDLDQHLEPVLRKHAHRAERGVWRPLSPPDGRYDRRLAGPQAD